LTDAFITTWLLYALAGGVVGFVIGLTGVGGGSFMTPILVSLFGIKMAVAVGTDLLYAAMTKANGVLVHRHQGTVEWKVVRRLSLGSVPASILTIVALRYVKDMGVDYTSYLTLTLGVMLILTSIVLLFRNFLIKERKHMSTEESEVGGFERRHAGPLTVVMGISLGVLVTMSSVGAGAFGAAVLMVLYPRMPMIRIIGTDLAHAVPLTLVAGLGHMLHMGSIDLANLQIGNVDLRLLSGLMAGSLPAIWLGTKLANRLPDNLIRPVMALILLSLGLKYTFF
jgi:hypothetical protein